MISPLPALKGRLIPLRFGETSKKPGKITYNPETQTHKVPDHVTIPVVEGDGIGPEIVKSAQKIVKRAVELAYGKARSITWKPMVIGKQSLAKGKELIPQEAIDTFKDHKIFVKAPLDTPLGGGFRSVNVQLRRMFDLFACIRPLKSLPGISTPVKRNNYDLVIFRENTDDIYQGVEFPKDSEGANEIIELLNGKYDAKIRPDSGIGIKPISESASKRFIENAMNYALENNRKIVTLVGKGNIMKFTEGAFVDWGKEVAQDKFSGRFVTEDQLWEKYEGKTENLPEDTFVLKTRITDAMMMDIITRPDQHDVIVNMNLNGDYMSDEGAGLIGGLGVAPGANMGTEYAMFESTHGSAPDIAGKGIANPTALLRTVVMMLDFMNWKEAAQKMSRGIEDTLKKGVMTGDLAVHINNEGGKKWFFGLLRHKIKPATTEEFTNAVIESMENPGQPNMFQKLMKKLSG